MLMWWRLIARAVFVFGATALAYGVVCRAQPATAPFEDEQTFVRRLKDEYAPRIRKAETKEERDRLEKEMWERLYSEAARRSGTLSIKLRGEIVDEGGTPINGVQITVQNIPNSVHGDLPAPEKLVADGRFNLSFRGSYLTIEFAKDGYYKVRIPLTDDPRPNQERFAALARQGVLSVGDKEGEIRVVLEKMGKTTKLRVFGGLLVRDDWDTTFIEFSKRPVLDLNKKEYVKVKGIKDVPVSCVVAMLDRDAESGKILLRQWTDRGTTYEVPAGLRLCLNTPTGGLVLYKPKRPAAGLREMKEAPDTGYGPELIASEQAINALARMSRGGSPNPEEYVYFFFKTGDGKYGKGTIYSIGTDVINKRLFMGVSFHLQPDGSRNLEDPAATER